MINFEKTFLIFSQAVSSDPGVDKFFEYFKWFLIIEWVIVIFAFYRVARYLKKVGSGLDDEDSD